MKKYFLHLLFFLPLFSFSQDDEARISTLLNGKIENWDVTYLKEEGNFEAYLMNDVNRWTFEIGTLSGEVNSEFNDQYNSWEITLGEKTYHLKTWLRNS